MRVVMATDPGGQAYFDQLRSCVESLGCEVREVDPELLEDNDWPDCVRHAALLVASGAADRGILIGPTGNGEALIVNRIAEARCAVCWDVRSALVARKELDSNLLAIGRNLVSLDRSLRIVETWLRRPFKRNSQRGPERLDHRLPDRIALGNPNGRGNHLSPFLDEPTYVCEHCREEFAFRLDLLDGATQDLIEECPICGQENVIRIEVATDGRIDAIGDPDVSH